MTDFLINVALPGGIVFSFLALVHCAVKRQGVAWFLITVLLGPFGGLAYLAGQMGWLPFTKREESRSPSTISTKSRRCPRCHQAVGVLYDYEDGRTILRLCQMCKSEMDFQRSNFSLPT